MNRLKFICCLMLCFAAASCATKGDFKVSPTGIQFPKATPSTISSAWIQDGKVWLVPKKNSAIESLLVNGETMTLVPDGAYFSAKAPSKRFKVQVNGNTQELIFE